MQQDLEPPQAVGPYQLSDYLGDGASGPDFRAFNYLLDMPVALRVLSF